MLQKGAGCGAARGMPRWRPWPLLQGALLLATSGRVSGKTRGEYGFLSQFHDISSEEVHRRVNQMRNGFGILEFEFYNAFEGYSRPPHPNDPEWFCKCFNTLVDRSILKSYTEAIRLAGGRSWLTVQAMATDPKDTEFQRGFKVVGNHTVQHQVLMDVVEINAKWAQRIVPHWIDFAQSVGFSGIHWAVLASGTAQDAHGFLVAAAPMFQARGLEQTMTFLNGAGWDASLTSMLAFPIWENWIGGDEEDFMSSMPDGSVYSSYPGKDASHNGEVWNQHYVGTSPLDVLIQRWQKARCHGLRYLALGDGHRALRTDYFPDATYLTRPEISRLREAAFERLACETGGNDLPAAPAAQEMSPYEKSCRGSERFGRLRFKVQQNRKLAAEILRDSAEALEIVIKGMFGFCRVNINTIREMQKHEHFGLNQWRTNVEPVAKQVVRVFQTRRLWGDQREPSPAGSSESLRRTNAEQEPAAPPERPTTGRRHPATARIEVTYMGTCMTDCFDEPVDSTAHLTKSLQYGFDQAQIPLQVTKSALEVQNQEEFYWANGNGEEMRILGFRLGSVMFYDVLFFAILPLCVVVVILLYVCICRENTETKDSREPDFSDSAADR